MIESLADPQVWIALGTLTFLEIVLGVDNIIFISILSGKLPENQQVRARRLGLLAAMLMRIESDWMILGYPGIAMVLFLVASLLGLWLVVTSIMEDR